MIFKTGLIDLIINNLYYFVGIGFLPILCFINISHQIDTNTYYHNWWQNIFFVLISLGWIIVWGIWLGKENAFIDIDGINSKTNREVCLEILKPTWKLSRNNKEYIIAFPDDKNWTNGRYLIILFREDKVLVNVFSMGFRNMKTPFFAIKDWKIRNKIKEEIIKEIEKYVA
nr:hypothetical protein [uncultured Carboxylicivirga sp.]